MSNTRKVLITWGQNTLATVVQELRVPEGATDCQIVDLAKAQADNVGNLVFDPSWDWTGLRIVSITETVDGKNNYIGEDIPIEPSAEDLGLVTRGALNGSYSLASILDESDRQGWTSNPDVEAGIRLASQVVQKQAGITIPSFAPKTLVLEAFAVGEYGESPAYAALELQPATIREMVRLAALGLAAHICVMHVDASDGIWSENDLCMRCTDMVVMPSLSGGVAEASVWWQAHPKHADYNCETRSFDLGALIACLSGNPPEGFVEKDGVLFWDGNNGGLDDLMDRYFTATRGGGNWVIYHAGQPVEERFWSEEDGWTNLAGATRYEEAPPAYPMGGPENTPAVPVCIGTMRPFTVMLARDPMATAYTFECFAEDGVHATEQAQNAYPEDQVQSVILTEEIES